MYEIKVLCIQKIIKEILLDVKWMYPNQIKFISPDFIKRNILSCTHLLLYN